MKKLICALAALLLCFPALSACENKPPKKPEQKQELLFLIDEGISGNDITSKYKNDLETMDEYLGNIMEAVRPLTEKFDVAFLIYLNWHYRESGYGGDASEALNRVSPELKHVLQFFTGTPYRIYLEAYSSGGYTNQNGELGNLPLVPLHYGDSEKIKSLPIDMEALAAIRREYPVVKGVRFHELIGSNIQSGNGHGFKVEPTAIYAIAQVCKETGMVLAWGDHSWGLIQNDSSQFWWEEIVENVSKTLGDKLIINTNNNSRQLMSSLKFKNIFNDGKHGRRWGLSCQSWYWAEAEVVMGVNWYQDSFMDMPPELMAVYTMEAFSKGASLVQFEPVAYFFNSNYPPASLANSDQSGFYEQAPDYTGTHALKVFSEFLLKENTEELPPLSAQAYYTDDETLLENNLELQSPKKYAQATVGAIGEEAKFYSKYSADEERFYSFDTPYLPSYITSGSVTDVQRINLTFNQFDQVILRKEIGSKTVAQFYNSFNALIYEDDALLADNADGKYIGMTALNLKQENVFDGDSDEIVVAREKNGIVNFTVYKAVKVQNPNPRKAFRYEAAPELKPILTAMAGGEIASADFVQIAGIRTRNALLPSRLRPLDGVAVITRSAGKLAVTGSIGGVAIKRTEITEPAGFLNVFALDIDFDGKDELAFAGSDKVKFYAFEGNAVYNANADLEIAAAGAQRMVGLRKATYYNALG